MKVVGILVFAAVVWVGAGTAGAAYPGGNGLIVFDSDRLGPDEIFTMKSSGAGVSPRTTNTNGFLGSDDDPVFSGDGRWIVFSSDQGAGRDLFRMRTNGTGLRRLTNSADDDEHPSISIDGKLIAWEVQAADSELWIMHADGTGKRRLADGAGDDDDPVFTPDGRTIYFESERTGSEEIWAISPNGKNLRRITHTNGSELVDDVDVSPNGRLLVLHFDFNIHVMRPNGTGLREITSTGSADRPVFSPDGKWIAYDDDIDGDTEIYKIRLAGGPAKQLTINSDDDDSPDWQPVNRCGGRLVTQVGTARRDRIRGTRRADVVVGHAGNDVIRGLRGNDRLCGNAGRDRLFGGPGRDRLYGGSGRDFLLGGPGPDLLRGGPGQDVEIP